MIIPDMPIPRISVVMSVFNGMPLLADAIDSILAQTMGDFEFIIVNDGSTDGSLATLQDYATRDTRIVIIDQVNTGLTKALIRGVAAARAPLIARMDADDISMPERFARQIELLETRPDLVAVSCGIEFVSHDLCSIAIAERRFDEVSLPLLMAFGNVISGHGQMMFRISAYDAAGGYDAEFRFAQDYDLWCRLLAHGPIGEADGVLYRFRVGHDSITTRYGGRQKELAATVATKQYQRIAGVTPKIEHVHDAMDWWLPNSNIYRTSIRQMMVNRHIRIALNKYATNHNINKTSLKSFNEHIAKILIQKRYGLPKSHIIRRSFFIALALYWAPQKILLSAISKSSFKASHLKPKVTP